MPKTTKKPDAPAAAPSADAKPVAPAKKKRKFGFADIVIILSVLTIGFVGWTWWYGVNVAPQLGADKDQKACIAFNDGLGKAHAAFTANDNQGYIDEFFKGNDAALLAADPNGSLIEMLTQVGMQRLSINYDMDAVTLVSYLEPLAAQVQGENYCAAILGVTITAPTATATPSS